MTSFNAGFNGGIPKIKLALKHDSTLIKAMLIPVDSKVPTIEFMFNPTELTFNCEVKVTESPGTQTQKEGQKKVNVSSIEPEAITISKILFDTYESGENVVEKYILPFRAAVNFVGSYEQAALVSLQGLPEPLQNAVASPLKDLSNAIQKATSNAEQDPSKKGADKRTPIYRFIWGEQTYLRRCSVAKLTYKLTLFLPDGTPVRAVIDSLTVKKVDENKPNEDPKKATVVDRIKGGMQARLNAKASFK